jgi:hypothetical protein
LTDTAGTARPLAPETGVVSILVADIKVLFCNTSVNQLITSYPQTAMTLKFCSQRGHLAGASDIKVLFPTGGG